MSAHSFPSLDGFPLGGAWHEAHIPAVAVAVIAPGMAIPSGFYRHFAEYLACRGVHVLRFDYRGVGASKRGRPEERTATATDWGRLDLSAAIDEALDRADGLPVFLVGHSFGGQCLGLTGRGPDLAGALTIGAQSGYHGHWDGAGHLGMKLFMGLWLPVVSHGFGRFPAWAGMKEEVPAGVALEWARWCRSPGYLTDHHPLAAGFFARVGGPVRVVGISDDGFAPPRAVDALASWIPGSERSTVRPEDHGLGSIGHFGFFHRARVSLWNEQVGWLLATAGALSLAA